MAGSRAQCFVGCVDLRLIAISASYVRALEPSIVAGGNLSRLCDVVACKGRHVGSYVVMSRFGGEPPLVFPKGASLP
eukprot:scaffold94802_cov32-Tisochrysis_lutea.AAC.1